jgi:phage recombination protein Bet
MKKTVKPRRRPTPRSTTTAIVPAAPTETIVGRRELRFSREQIDLIKNTVAKGTTNEQLELFLYVCKKHRLDPLAKQIYCVLWPREGGKYHEMVIITGINGFRTTAARDHKDFAGTSKAEFTYQETILKTPAGRRIPTSCTIKAFRKGSEPSEAEVFWEEFAPTDLKASRSDFWNRMPKHMLAKCAEAHALRKAYPDLSDVYVEEEVAQRIADFTPGGREIVLAGGVNPSGRVAESRHSDPIRDKAMAELRAKGLWCDRHNGPTSRCPSDEHTQAELEAMWQAEKAAKAQTIQMPQNTPTAGQNGGIHSSSESKPRFLGTVEVDWPTPASPRVFGAIANLLPMIQKHCKAEWGKDSFWHIRPEDVATIREMCKQSSYEFVETVPKKSSGDKGKPETKPSGTNAKPGAKQESPSPTTVSGTISRVQPDVKYAVVTLVTKDGKKPTWKCFNKDVSDILLKNLGRAAEVIIQSRESKGVMYTNLVGIKMCAGVEYDEDGKTPIIQQRDREAGTKTLFT